MSSPHCRVGVMTPSGGLFTPTPRLLHGAPEPRFESRVPVHRYSRIGLSTGEERHEPCNGMVPR